MRSRWLPFLLLLVCGIVLFGCSSGEDSSPETEPVATDATSEETVPETEAPTEETQPSAPAVPSEGEATGPGTSETSGAPDPADAFGEAQLALEDLESYRYTTTFVFAGEEDGEPEAGSIELTGEIAGPDRKHLIWRDLQQDDSFEVVQIGDEAWILEDGQWEQAPVVVADAMSQAALVYAPSVTWSGLFGELEPDATYVGSEVINGIPAHHYSAAYRQWGAYWQGELIDAAGDVWIAEDGYPVKYHFSATGIDENGDRGTVTWTMELSDVNAPIVIEVPE